MSVGNELLSGLPAKKVVYSMRTYRSYNICKLLLMFTMGKIILFVFIFLQSFQVLAQNESIQIKQIKWATPEWENYTNKDGTGLYNEILQNIFEDEKINIRIIRIYVPWKRAVMMVKNGTADITGADEPQAELLHSKHPVVQNKENVFFHKDRIRNWKGIESLKDKTGVWYMGYLDNQPPYIKEVLRGRGNSSRVAALKMVIFQRVDYYYDNMDQMNTTIHNFDIPFHMEDYQIENIRTLSLYMLFNKTKKGEKLRQIFDDGIERLLRSGKLKKIFDKWNQDFPDYDIDIQ